MSEIKRKRNKTLSIRLTEKEQKLIYSKAKKAKMTVTDYIVALSIDKQINIVEDLKPMLAELKAYGRNLNQLTVLSHLGKTNEVNLTEAVELLQKNYDGIFKLIRKTGGD